MLMDRERVPRVKLVSVRYRQNGEELVGAAHGGRCRA